MVGRGPRSDAVARISIADPRTRRSFRIVFESQDKCTIGKEILAPEPVKVTHGIDSEPPSLPLVGQRTIEKPV
jgi:hypothetical protein